MSATTAAPKDERLVKTSRLTRTLRRPELGALLGALVAIPMLAGLCGMLLVRRDPVLTRRAT